MDDWQVGDLALCVNVSTFQIGTGRDLVRGRIYTVTEIGPTPAGVLGLRLDGIPVREYDLAHGFKQAKRFRKIRPHQPDEEDCETITLLTGKREPVA